MMAFLSEMAIMTYATLSSVYRITEANLDPLQLILVGTVLEISVFLFEVPTGAFADVSGRKLSIVTGFALIGAGFILEGVIPVFGAILLAQVVWGLGFTFTSGARQAWLADELGNDANTSKAFVRAARFEFAGSLVGIGVSVILGSVFVGLAVIGGGVMYLCLALIVLLVMPERRFERACMASGEMWRPLAQTLWDGLGAVRCSRVLALLMAIEIFYGTFSQPFDRLWPKYALDTYSFPQIVGFDNVIWFGIVQVSAMFMGMGVIWWMESNLSIESPQVMRRVLSLINALTIGAGLAFALVGSFGISISMVALIWTLRRVRSPLTAAWLNQSAGPSHRATLFSFHEQANSLGRALFGPGIGLMASRFGLRIALLATMLMLVPAQMIYPLAQRSHERHAE